MVATLVSTLLGTFTAAATLHDKVQDKRYQAKQKQTDQGQDNQIQSLRQDVERMQLREEHDRLQGKNEASDRSRSQSRSRRNRSRRRRSVDDGDEGGSDDFDRSAERSRALIAQEYEANVARMGQRYAEGDVIAENKLQAQIIALQQTVIDVLQDALMNGRSLSKADIQRLIAAQDRAKQGSLDAMRDQYQRMLVDENRRRSLVEDDARRQLTLPAPAVDSPSDDFAQPRRVRTVPANLGSLSPASLYCRYAADLQTNYRKAIHPAFSPQGSQRCPACDVRVPISTQSVWVLETRTPLPRHQQDERGDLVELRRYTMHARLVLKSHTPAGDFACVLCYQDRDRGADCHCSSVEALVRHIGRDHTHDDFESEVDIWRE